MLNLFILLTTIILTFIAINLVVLAIVTRNRGCSDIRALNYDKNVNLHDTSLCTYNLPSPKLDKPGCTQSWSYNYDKDAIVDDNTCININLLMNILTILSSIKRTVVTINDQLVINGGSRGLTFILINRNDIFSVKSINTFDIGVSCDEITKMIEFIDNIKDHIVIVVSRGETFNLFETKIHNVLIARAMQAMGTIGRKNVYFDTNTNYILIGSKKKDIYYETASIDDIYFPQLEMIENHCKINTAYPKPTKHTYYYRDLVSIEDHKFKCALEASRKGLSSFGLERNTCILMNDDEWNSFKKLPSGVHCNEGIGSFRAISGFKFRKSTNNNAIFLNRDIGVSLFSNSNFTGKTTILREGVHDISTFGQVKSIIIPRNYNVHISDAKKNVTSLFENTKMKIDLKNTSIIYIIKLYEDRVSFCGSIDGRTNCYIFSPGKYSIPGFLYHKIRYINATPSINRVILYQDSNFLDPIANFNIDENSLIHTIEFPKIVRSIKILK